MSRPGFSEEAANFFQEKKVVLVVKVKGQRPVPIRTGRTNIVNNCPAIKPKLLGHLSSKR